MQPLKVVNLTHANNKVKVTVVVGQIAFYYLSEASKSTYLMSSGGAIIPVVETPEEITKLLVQQENESNVDNN